MDYIFQEDLAVGGKAQTRRFTVPLQVLRMVRERVRAGKRYDVVEIHEPLAAPYCLARISYRRLPPVTIMSHGIEERGRLLKLAYRQHKGLPVSFKQRYSSLSVVLQAMYSLRHANHVLCCNQQDVDYLIAHGVPAQRLTRHFNAVEPSFVEAGQTLTREEQAFANILFIGSWIERKGILDLVPAVSQTLRCCPQSHFTIAGCAIAPETMLAAFAPELHSRIHVLPKIASDAGVAGNIQTAWDFRAAFVCGGAADGDDRGCRDENGDCHDRRIGDAGFH